MFRSSFAADGNSKFTHGEIALEFTVGVPESTDYGKGTQFLYPIVSTLPIRSDSCCLSNQLSNVPHAIHALGQAGHLARGYLRHRVQEVYTGDQLAPTCCGAWADHCTAAS